MAITDIPPARHSQKNFPHPSQTDGNKKSGMMPECCSEKPCLNEPAIMAGWFI
jgi:hypothetical protein